MRRAQVLVGGVSLGLRHVIGIAISMMGAFVLARILGPLPFGQYAVVAFGTTVLGSVADLGLPLYLVRLQQPPVREDVNTVFLFTQGFSLIAGLISAVVLGPVFATWFGAPEFLAAFTLGGATLYVGAWAKVPNALLERELSYATIGAFEIIGLVLYYLTAVALALAGLGLTALLCADLARSFLTSALLWVRRPIHLTGGINRETAKCALKYGAEFTFSSSLWTVNAGLGPLVVGKLVDLEAAGYLRQAYNLLNQAGFLRAVVWRISFPVLPEVVRHPIKLRRTVRESLSCQLLLVVMPVMMVAGLAPWLVPTLLGDRWAPAVPLALLAALPLAVNSLFGLMFAPLYVVGETSSVTRFFFVYALSLWPVAIFAIITAGAAGLPIAEIVCLPTYCLAYRYFRNRFGAVPTTQVWATVLLLYGVGAAAYLARPFWFTLVVAIIGSVAVLISDGGIRLFIRELGGLLVLGHHGSSVRPAA